MHSALYSYAFHFLAAASCKLQRAREKVEKEKEKEGEEQQKWHVASKFFTHFSRSAFIARGGESGDTGRHRSK